MPTDTPINYEAALTAYKKAKKALDKAHGAESKAHNALQLARMALELECGVCTKTTPVKAIEVIHKMFGGSFDYNKGEHRYNTQNVWVCPHCHSVLETPKDTGPWVEGFTRYVKTVHKWYSSEAAPSGRVKELLTPSIEAEEAKMRLANKQRRIKEAEELLRSEGLLKE